MLRPSSIGGFEPVDQRVALRQAKDPRLRVARLRLGRDRSDFDEAEAHGAEGIDAAGVLVEAGRQPDAVRERQSCQGDPVGHARRRVGAGQRRVLGAGQRIQGQFVGPFGVEAEQEGAGKPVKRGGQGQEHRIILGFRLQSAQDSPR
jgi:hypothetical protein